MMKIMIVDDEVQIRKGMYLKLNLTDQACEVIGEASDGKEALEKLASNAADLVITDMRMPVMDGLAFTKECKKQFPHIKIIVLSGYSDFDYVKNAMKEGASDYLLKPVSPDDLEATLSKMKQEIEHEKVEKQELNKIKRAARYAFEDERRKYLLYAANGEWLNQEAVGERLKQLQFNELADPDAVIRILTIEARGTDGESSRPKKLWESFRLLCNEISGQFDQIWLFENPAYPSLIHAVSLLHHRDEQSFIRKVQDQSKSLLNLYTVIGAGESVTGFDKMKDSYLSSLLAWSQSPLEAGAHLYREDQHSLQGTGLSPEFERIMMSASEQGDVKPVSDLIKKELVKLGQHSAYSFTVGANRILFLLGTIVQKYELKDPSISQSIWLCQQEVRQMTNYVTVMNSIILVSETITQAVHSVRFSGSKVTDSVKQYLDMHYAEDISLSVLSDLFHMNGTYLSELFKQQTGQNFTDYLVKVRMKKAADFLKDHRLKIIDVAELTGYSSAGYFSTVFKKHYACSPVEYRRQQYTGSVDREVD